MKLFLSLALALFLITFGFAQDSEPVILVSSTAKVMYSSPNNSKTTRVFPGALLLPEGVIYVKGAGTATLQYKRNLVTIVGKEKRALSSLFPEGTSMRRLGFAGDFTTQVENAYQMAYFQPKESNLPWANIDAQKGMGDGWVIRGSSQDTSVTAESKGTGDGWVIRGGSQDTSATAGSKRTGDGWGIRGGSRDTSNAKVATMGTGDGWGDGSSLTPSYPFGHLTYGPTNFEWSGPDGKDFYVVEVKNDEGRPVAKGTTNKKTLTLSLSPEALEDGATYTWQVRTVGTNSVQSSPLTFMMLSSEAREAVKSRAVKQDIYNQSDIATRLLMEAVAYESAEWYAEAITAYKTAIQLQGKRSNSARLLYAAFWQRLGLKDQAISSFAGSRRKPTPGQPTGRKNNPRSRR